MKRRLLAALALCALALAACKNDGAPGGCPTAEPAGTPISAPVMAFLSAARALHHEADIKEKAGDVAGAIASLERLVALQAPQADEVDEVLADAHARLAELRLRLADLDRAEAEVKAGLQRASGPTYFRGHLLEVEGLVEEARAASLADAGRAEEASRARARAIALLEEAVQTQEQVIDRALEDGGRP
jgi:hypothetical protein